MDLEDARREVLQVPEHYEFGADDYLDLLAEELLADRRRMVSAAPTTLARLLIESGNTRAGLAAAIGVSVTAVGHWASGAKPLPEGRLDEIAFYLGVEPWRADPLGILTSEEWAELSYFEWIIRFVVDVEPATLRRSAIATRLGITPAKLRGYTHGGVEVPEDIIRVFVKHYVPGMAPYLGDEST